MRLRAFVTSCALGAVGCASSGSVSTPASVLAVRTPQTRSYETDDRRAVMTAMVEGLQDAGFQVVQVDSETGFVSANAENVEGHEASSLVKGIFWPYALAFPGLFGHRKHTIVEATGTLLGDEHG